ncbi:MAG: LamG domain-containing protein [Pirellulales bacterium]
MSFTPWKRPLGMVAFAMLLATPQSLYGAMLLNYQFETVDGSPPGGQTTPDSSGNFTSAAGTVNAVLGHGTNTPGTDFPNLVAGPVENVSAGVRSRNPESAMNFPGNPVTGNINTNVERVEIADASSGALDATFTNFTVALWLNPSSTSRGRFAIGKLGNNGSRGWQISSADGTTDLSVDYYSTINNLTDRSLTVANALPLNTWTHVIFAFDGTNGTEAIYVNNVLQQNVNSAASSLLTVPAILNGSNGTPFRVGHRGGNQNSVGAWAGGIDDVMIFNETLAYSRTGSATGTGSLLVPEPASLTATFMGLALAMGAFQRRRL